ncbi:protein MTSS 2-like isoform X4 [Denticeps clupeoides]|uniref:protein MTSS 2-like isoform X4 n=1 Tax=Denticeps clupeoides TaxID=299321 RepID=UPI0010A44C42|nr:protein MTSS 2-like isoform X4 [Denticeps clupeoides]
MEPNPGSVRYTMEGVEKDCGALGGLFQALVNDMKYSYPVWEDFTAKATKLHSQLRTTVLAAAAFLDAFQKVADMATSTRGATRDIGSALTRMCMRHRSIEAKLRHLTNALMEKLIAPLHDKIEEWKKTSALLDKDHAKEYKRSCQEIKKKSSDTLRLQKKARKEISGRGGLQPRLSSAMQDVSDMFLLMQETEKQAVRRALVEERGRYCTFISLLQPVVKGEISMLGEVTHLQAIIDDLTVLTTDPHKLPAASEQVIVDLKGSDYSWSYQTPPSSPSSTGSRKSSLCSLVHLPPGGPHRLSSVSSHDSGFVSQDAAARPVPSDLTSQDWSKSASYHLPPALTQLRRNELLYGSRGHAGTKPEEPHKARMSPAAGTKHGKAMSSAASELAMVLTRGLSVEQQRSSRDSLQYSSGYSTQNTTPCCSEDAIPSHGYDYDCHSMNGDGDADPQTDFDKSCTVPHHSNLAQNYRRMVQTKRPASTAGLPGNGGAGGAGTSGTATIRRTPSSKTAVRRVPSSAGPIPIRPPIVPVKTPTAPDSPGFPPPPPESNGSQESLYMYDYTRASPGTDTSVHEDDLLAANRHSLIEKISKLADGAHALGDGHFPFPSGTDPAPQEGEDILKTIRRGVKLRKAACDDRSAPKLRP